MKIARFQALAESFGADILRWPPSERGEAQQLLEQSEQARCIFERARRLDTLLAEAHVAAETRHWPRGVEEQQAALSDLRTNVLARIAQRSLAPSRPQEQLRRIGTGLANYLWPFSGTRHGVGFAAT